MGSLRRLLLLVGGAAVGLVLTLSLALQLVAFGYSTIMLIGTLAALATTAACAFGLLSLWRMRRRPAEERETHEERANLALGGLCLIVFVGAGVAQAWSLAGHERPSEPFAGRVERIRVDVDRKGWRHLDVKVDTLPDSLRWSCRRADCRGYEGLLAAERTSPVQATGRRIGDQLVALSLDGRPLLDEAAERRRLRGESRELSIAILCLTLLLTLGLGWFLWRRRGGYADPTMVRTLRAHAALRRLQGGPRQ